MKPMFLPAVLLAVSNALVFGVASGATTLEREIGFDPSRVRLETRGGATEVSIAGAAREFRPGLPDLPWLGERIELPAGMRLTGVEVVAMESSPIAEGARIPSAARPRPGLGPIERTVPDPATYGSSGFWPAVPVEIGIQGFERGANVAWLKLSPVRWDPATGRLEVVRSLRVRLTLEPTLSRPLERERVVREWETSTPQGMRSLAAAPLAASPLAATAPARQQPFSPTQLPSVMGSPVEYLIITDETMQAEFQRLADWKTQSGVPAAVRTLSFIRQEYPGGSDDAERIRSFIKDAYTRWGTRWVLLGGDTEVLPTRYATTTFHNGDVIPTDLYYGCLDGNWNADGDRYYGEGYFSSDDPGDDADLMPEVYVGRAPCVSAAQAQVFVDKTLLYEKTPVTDYMTRLLFFAEVLFPQPWSPGTWIDFDGADLVEEVMPYVLVNPNVRMARLYESLPDTTYTPGAFLETRQAVIDSLNVGYNVSVHIGHGYRNVMSVGDGSLDNYDASSLTNGNRVTNLYAINCTSNAIDFPSIGEAFVLNPHGGAVTNIGSTNVDYPYAGRVYEDEYFRVINQDSVNAVGEALAQSKAPYVPGAFFDGVHRWTIMTLVMLGDPDLRIYTGTPRTLVVTRAATMSASDSTFAVNVKIGTTPLYGARVVGYQAGMDYRIVTTDGAGDAVLPFRPDSVGSFTLTVVAYDCVPYQATVPIVASALPVLAADPPLIDDDSAGGSSGNGNGVVDAGETVDLRIALRNNGGSSAAGVSGTLSTTDPDVSVTVPACSYGTLAAGATSNPATGFRIVVPYTAADQHEVPFELTSTDGDGRVYRARFQLVVRAPELHNFGHSVLDQGGNYDGRPDPGETVSYYVKLRNMGTGVAQGVTAKLRSLDGLATVVDSTSSWGDITPAQEQLGDALVFVPSSPYALLELEISDQYGVVSTQTLDIGYPAAPSGVSAIGRATSVQVGWTANTDGDLLGYYCYRSLSAGGPFTRVNSVPTDRIAAYIDEGLAPLTRYYYKISALDLSGNESSPSAAASASTNPPLHAIFPIPMGRETPSSVALDHLYPGYAIDIVAGADVLYAWHADGTAPVDADGAGSTSGDFTRRGVYYAAGPSIGDLDGGDPEVVGLSWGTEPNPGLTGDSMFVAVFDLAGNPKPGWPRPLASSVWSSAALGDVGGDGRREVVFGSNADKVYAFHSDGTELLDGDSNPATIGVFKVLGSPFNYCTPALADLDGDGKLDIIYGSTDGNLYAWRWDGSNVPGFPVTIGASMNASPAVGYLDGAGDTELDIVEPANNDSLYVIRANGARRAGFPQWIKFSGSSKAPSPALADMNNDGYLDIVVASTNGGIYVYNRNGGIVIPWLNIRYSTMTNAASESSPVVADINGDGKNDVVMGDETGTLSALSGANGTQLPGFPIVLQGEIRGAAGLCDCDGDGLTEIVLSGWDRQLHVWDYNFPFSPNGPPPWPQFHHDAARSGLSTNPVFVGVDGAPSGAPPPVLARELGPPAPNPATAMAIAWYAVPPASAGQPFELAVFDLAGRKLRTLDRGIARAGRYPVEWNLRRGDGAPVTNGIYFLRYTLGSVTQTRKVVVLR
jgi:hypothetical protein